MTNGAYLRYPHLHGELVTFVADDDVWVAPLEGGRAWRFTADRVPVSHPFFSPDGGRIAWTSTREGAPEVFVADLDGGEGERLTHWGDELTGVRGWSEDGRVIAISSVGQGARNRTWAHAVPLDGGAAERLPYGWVGDVSVSDARVAVVSANNTEASRWKRYRGGRAHKLWVDTSGDGVFTRLFADSAAQYWSARWVGERLAFLADHEGVGNLYSVLPDGSDLRKHTSHEQFYARHATTDGRRIVYSHAGDLWLTELDGEPRKLDITLGGPRPGRAPAPVPNTIESFAPDSAGRASTVEIRGTAHWLTHRDGPAGALRAEPGVRVRLPQPLDGEGKAVWVSDADGEDTLEIGAPGGPRRTIGGDLGRVLALKAAPDGKHVALAAHDGRLLLVTVDTGQVRELDRTAYGDVSGLTFSPDSAWLAWVHPHDDWLKQIRMARVEGGGPIDVTPVRFNDHSPAFTLDGRYLAFLSERTFDPVYDSQVFDVSFANSCKPYLVPLKATTPSPLDPSLLGRGWEPEENGEEPVRVEVDAEGLDQRVVALPVPAGRYGNLRAAKDALLWLRLPLNGVLGNGVDQERPVLERYDLAKRCKSELAKDVTLFEVGGDRVVMHGKNGLRVRPASEGDDVVTVELDRITIVVDPVAEWRQMYQEAARLMRDHFWRDDMDGVDWQAAVDRYAPLVERIGCRSELMDLLWEVQGELATSHAYVIEPLPTGRQGKLGADLVRDGDAWRVGRILPGESSDHSARSPLLAPGVAVREGDEIVAVNGRAVDPVRGPAASLSGTAGRAVELTVRPAAGGEIRRVVVTPLGDDRPLRYHDWVRNRRALVRELSGGRLGYLHIPDMMANGWANFHRDIHVETGLEGLIVDVRENRGGHLSNLVLEKVSRPVTGWAHSRGYSAIREPENSPRGPVVAVTDEFAASDGDIVSAGFKNRAIGPLVGTRTWGGVVGIDMRYALVDGLMVTQPRYGLWLKDHGWEVENHGVEPDVEVVITPQDRVAGRDPQLEKAVELALAALAERPAAVPPELPAPRS
ncbi:S41 family peptidase [Nonomuraea sp. NPDC050663]|uniref:S41 family peptidase n=1 Tax=Nonomuraea sp. NPDC050663 TaxID=3364370 RepID=UPI003798734F